MKNNFKMKCNHKRLKKNYPLGRKSTPIIKCKDCGEIISKNQLSKERKNKSRWGDKRR